MTRPRKKLQDKVLVVVGGTTGIGRSAAEAFLDEGARIIVIGRDAAHVAAARKAFGARTLVIRADASNPATVAQAIARGVNRFGRFDGLYHVAGGSGRRFGDGPLHEITDAGWRQTLEWNLTSVFYSNRAAIEFWLEHNQPGTVLNMSSVLAFSPSPRYFATHAYATAKSAIIGLTRSAAASYASNNIRFNAIAPALVETPMSERAQQNSDIMRFIARKQPLDGGRIGQPSDLNAAAVFFLSDESRFVTGQVLAIDGGWCLSEVDRSD